MVFIDTWPPAVPLENIRLKGRDRASARDRRHGSTAPVERVPSVPSTIFILPRRHGHGTGASRFLPSKNGRHGRSTGTFRIALISAFRMIKATMLTNCTTVKSGILRTAAYSQTTHFATLRFLNFIFPTRASRLMLPPCRESTRQTRPAHNVVLYPSTRHGRAVDRAVPSRIFSTPRRAMSRRPVPVEHPSIRRPLPSRQRVEP
ncbi:hypothetical protein B0H10DRAFT_326331 [Mycena sp. CBHHK59/15]|nr:hypothetical protein B0H10DRAFT_326331 [Mycena sp. CBHHK59/15]